MLPSVNSKPTPEEKEKEEVILQCDIDPRGNGYTVFAKSPLIESWVETLPGGDPDSVMRCSGWGSKVEVHQAAIPLWGIEGISWTHFGGPLVLNDGVVNLSFLLTKGLREGVTLKFNGVLGQAGQHQFETTLRNVIPILYDEYLRTGDLKITFSVKSERAA